MDFLSTLIGLIIAGIVIGGTLLLFIQPNNESFYASRWKK